MNGEVGAAMTELALVSVGLFLLSSSLQQQKMLIVHYLGVILGFVL